MLQREEPFSSVELDWLTKVVLQEVNRSAKVERKEPKRIRHD
jgi:hypothetical protein